MDEIELEKELLVDAEDFKKETEDFDSEKLYHEILDRLGIEDPKRGD